MRPLLFLLHFVFVAQWCDLFICICGAGCWQTMRFRVIVKRVALATSAVVGGASLGVWALTKLQKDEVSV